MALQLIVVMLAERRALHATRVAIAVEAVVMESRPIVVAGRHMSPHVAACC